MTEQIDPKQIALGILNRNIEKNCQQCSEPNCPVAIIYDHDKQPLLPHCYRAQRRINCLNDMIVKDEEFAKLCKENGMNDPVIITLDQLCEAILERRKKK